MNGPSPSTSDITYPTTLNVLQPELSTLMQLDDPDTFLVVLEMFAQQYATFQQDVEHAIATSNGPELQMLVHTLKGTSGALGLQRLHEISTEIDLQLTQRIDFDTLDIMPLFRYMNLSIHDCNNILELNVKAKPDNRSDNDADLSDLLVQLRQKLKNHEHIGPQFTDLLKTVLKEHNMTQYDGVIELVDQFDYTKAYETLISIEGKC